MKANERKFVKAITFIDNKPVSVRRMKCSAAGCDFEGELIDKTRDGMPSIVVERRFRGKGWLVGRSERDDLCPACITKKQVERRQKKIKAENEVIEMDIAVPPKAAVTVVADQPRKMEREDRRIILAKLNDVYIDEASGYQSPWTDRKVAEDLGVPQAWVATLRDENFGPAADNQEIREMLRNVEAQAKDAVKLLADAKAIRAEGASLVERINELNRRSIEIGKSLDGLLSVSDRIRKAVA